MTENSRISIRLRIDAVLRVRSEPRLVRLGTLFRYISRRLGPKANLPKVNRMKSWYEIRQSSETREVVFQSQDGFQDQSTCKPGDESQDLIFRESDRSWY